MKVKEATEKLKRYTGDELYKEAREMFLIEVDQLIQLRTRQGKSKPSPHLVEGVLDQVSDWFRRVAQNLDWTNSSVEDLPEKIIEWERGTTFAKYNAVDPKFEEWRKRTHLEMLKGSSMPMLTAMREGDLEAASSFILGRITQDAKAYSELHEKRKAYADKLRKKICFFEEKQRSCEHQETYSIVEGTLPTNTSDLVFVCKLEKCIKEQVHVRADVVEYAKPFLKSEE